MRRAPALFLRLAAGLVSLSVLGCEADDGSQDGASAASGGRSSDGTGALGSGGSSGGGGSSTGGSSTSGGASSGGSIGAGGAGGVDTGGASGGGAGTGGAPPTVPLTVFVAGDSTVSTYADTASPGDQAGWGQMLHEHFNDLVTIENRAIGGRTARRFIDDGALDAIWSDIAAGDYLFVQFGTNDGNKTATYTLGSQTIPYYLDPSTDFKAYLSKYVAGARERGVTPVLVTPPPRNSAYCTGGNGTGGHAQAMRDLGAAESVAVLDLNARTVAHLKAICPAPTPEDFFLLRTDGTVDGTHFQENGARHLASFIALELAESGLPLAGYLEP